MSVGIGCTATTCWVGIAPLLVDIAGTTRGLDEGVNLVGANLEAKIKTYLPVTGGCANSAFFGKRVSPKFWRDDMEATPICGRRGVRIIDIVLQHSLYVSLCCYSVGIHQHFLR